jgi:hypothetical protein
MNRALRVMGREMVSALLPKGRGREAPGVYLLKETNS